MAFDSINFCVAEKKIVTKKSAMMLLVESKIRPVDRYNDKTYSKQEVNLHNMILTKAHHSYKLLCS